MHDFSLDLASETINDSRTKEYFKEVLSSYNNGNYRAAIVTLHSVVICDLIYKMLTLKVTYSDPVAEEILTQVEQMQKDDPQGAKWENKLVEMIVNKTVLLDQAEAIHFYGLKQERNLAAHPTLSGNYKLLTPNKETVRAYIRNMLEAVLIKPPLLSKEIFNDFIGDIARVYQIHIQPGNFEKYLTDRYFKYLTPAVEWGLFKNLWGLALHCKSEECKQHRQANLETLLILYKRHPQQMLTGIKNEANALCRKVRPELVKYIVYICSKFPEIHPVLDGDVQTLMAEKVEANENLKAFAWFSFPTIEEYISWVKAEGETMPRFASNTEIKPSVAFQAAKRIVRQQAGDSAWVDLVIHLFGRAINFNHANWLTPHIVDALAVMERGQMIELLEAINQNSQIYARGGAKTSHLMIRHRAEELLGSEFDFKNYPNFVKSLK